MIFVINKLKYDTDKMELISKKIEEVFTLDFGYKHRESCDLFVSKKGRWLAVTNNECTIVKAKALTEEEARETLMKHDLEAYEKRFGELEEA